MLLLCLVVAGVVSDVIESLPSLETVWFEAATQFCDGRRVLHPYRCKDNRNDLFS